jgi:glycosyltransferase involved in cell wall biosynthesis
MISLDSGALKRNSAVAKRLRKYAGYLDRLSVIVYTSAKNLKVVRMGNVFVYPSNSRTKFSFPFDAVKIGSFINEKNPVNFIVSQDAHSTGLAGLMLKKKFCVPFQVQLHGDYINNKWWISTPLHRMLNALAVKIVKGADSVRVVSRRVEKRIRALGVRRIIRIPIPVDVKRFEKSRSAGIVGFPVFLFVGRLSAEKNVGLLINAFAGLKREFPKGRLVIVGDGSEKSRLVALAKRLSVDRSVVFVGLADPAPYYKAATCLVLPSLHEGWGLVAVEASSAGCPVVMSDVGCAGEIIINNKSGLVFPVNDGGKLAEAMGLLAKDSRLRKRLAGGAKKLILKLPSEEKSIKMIVESWKP